MDAVPEENALDYILNYGMITADVSPESDLDQALKNMMSGDTLVFVEGSCDVLTINSKGYPEPGRTVCGVGSDASRAEDSFTESVRF